MKKNTLRTGTSITLMVFGITFVLAASLFWTNYALSASQVSNTQYLESTVVPTLSVHSLQISPTPTPFAPLAVDNEDVQDNLGEQGTALVLREDPDGSQENNWLPVLTGSGSPESAESGDEAPLDGEPAPAQDQDQPDGSEAGTQPTQDGEPTQDSPANPDAEQETEGQDDIPLLGDGEPAVQQPITDTLDGPPTPVADGDLSSDFAITTTVEISETFTPWVPSPPLVRISIPALKLKRAIKEIGWINKKNGKNEWDTDSLFANQNRQDLVGHLEGSALPGEGENIVLVGHNYDWGIYQWEGVFAKLKKLSPGDKIKLYSEGGEEHIYYIEEVKVISFANNNKNLAKHARLMGLTNSERLTLVTCGGANIGLWNKRVYVIAVPAEQVGE